MDYYEVLGLKSDANQSDIKKAYRNLVKVHHPDIGGSEERFKNISQAYETLSDSTKKKEYDLKNTFRSGNFDNFYNQFGGDFSNMFDNAFNQSAKGSDITIRLGITLEEVYHGVHTDITVIVKDEVLFDQIGPTLQVGRYHSWVVDAALPEVLEATSVDINGQVMSLRHKIFDVKGVQFHPESVLTPNGKQLLKNWINS